MINQYLQQLQEGTLFSDKTISIDLNKFENGESKKLIIVGLSGAGKSTLGNYLSNKYDCHFNELDLCFRSKLTEEEHRKFFHGEIDVEFDKLMFQRFYKACCKPTLLSNKKEVVEGAIFQVYSLIPSTRSLINKYPVIIIGKSVVKAAWDRTQRSLRNEKNKDVTLNVKFKKLMIGFFLNYNYIQKQLDIFKEERLKVGGNVKEFIIPELEGVVKR